MKKFGIVAAVMVAIAITLAGMAGAVNLSTGPKPVAVICNGPVESMITGNALCALQEFDECVTLDGWGKSNTPPGSIVYEEGVMKSPAQESDEIVLTERYFEGVMESGTTLNMANIMSQLAGIYNGRGVPSEFETAKSLGAVPDHIS